MTVDQAAVERVTGVIKNRARETTLGKLQRLLEAVEGVIKSEFGEPTMQSGRFLVWTPEALAVLQLLPIAFKPNTDDAPTWGFTGRGDCETKLAAVTEPEIERLTAQLVAAVGDPSAVAKRDADLDRLRPTPGREAVGRRSPIGKCTTCGKDFTADAEASLGLVLCAACRGGA